MDPMQQEQIKQAQLQSQAQQGLGTPPPAPFEYTPNVVHEKGKAFIAENIDAAQRALQEKAQAQSGQQGYAGRQGDPSAGVQGNPEGDPAHPNTGWNPSSPEAHEMNVQLADRIKSGQLDIKTAMIAIQNPEVAPEIKQALGQIIQQSQTSGGSNAVAQGQPEQGMQPQEQAPQAGLGQVPQQ